MANTIAVRVPNKCGDDVAITNFFEDGAISHPGYCVVDVNGEEAHVSIETLQQALIALEVVHGSP